jgi:hypothetical protein
VPPPRASASSASASSTAARAARRSASRSFSPTARCFFTCRRRRTFSTSLPLYLFASLPLYHFTSLPLYHFTSLPLYLFTFVPPHSYRGWHGTILVAELLEGTVCVTTTWSSSVICAHVLLQPAAPPGTAACSMEMDGR